MLLVIEEPLRSVEQSSSSRRAVIEGAPSKGVWRISSFSVLHVTYSVRDK